MSGAKEVNDWVAEHDLRIWREYRDTDGELTVLPSDFLGESTRSRLSRFDRLQQAHQAYRDASVQYKEKFLEACAPDADAFLSVGYQKAGQRLFETPRLLVAGSFLELRDEDANVPDDPFSIDIDTDRIPDSIPLHSRDGSGLTAYELKAVLLADQFEQADVDQLVGMMERTGRGELRGSYESIRTAIEESSRKGMFRNALATDVRALLARNQEKIEDAVQQYVFSRPDNEQPFVTPEERQSQRRDHEESVRELDETREVARAGYATVAELDSLRDRVVQLAEIVSSGQRDHERVRELEDDISDIWSEIEGNEEALETLRRDRNEFARRVGQQISELEAEVSNGSDVGGLDARLDEMEREVQRLRNDTADALRNTSARVDELDDVVQELRHEIGTLREDLKNADGDEHERLLEEFEERRALLSELEERVERWEAEQAALEARLNTETNASEDDAGVDVRGLDATMFDYLSRSALTRFEESIEDASEIGIYHPESRERLDVSETYDWSRHQESGERPLEAPGDGAQLVNRYRRFTLARPSGLLGNTIEVALEAVVYGRPEWFDAAQDADPSPMTMRDLYDFLDAASYFTRSESVSYSTVLCVVSPAGVHESVREALTTEQRRSRLHPNLAVCVADLQRGELVYDDRVGAVEHNAYFFEQDTGADYDTECERDLRSLAESSATERVMLSEIVDEYGYPAHVVLRVFRNLDDDGVGDLLDLDEMGVEFKFSNTDS